MPKSSKLPEDPLEVLIDRSLGRYDVPEALSEKGFVVHTLASLYGDGAEQFVKDEDWLSDASALALVVLTKDNSFRRVPIERETMRRVKSRVFCLSNQNLVGENQVAYFVGNRHRIAQRARKPGPFVWTIYDERTMTKTWPR